MKSPKKVPKQALRRDVPLTCPPRLEGRVKNARVKPVRKPKAPRKEPQRPGKMQGMTERQRKDYQLKSTRNK